MPVYIHRNHALQDSDALLHEHLQGNIDKLSQAEKSKAEAKGVIPEQVEVKALLDDAKDYRLKYAGGSTLVAQCKCLDGTWKESSIDLDKIREF
jgi:hypothetical protein